MRPEEAPDFRSLLEPSSLSGCARNLPDFLVQLSPASIILLIYFFSPLSTSRESKSGSCSSHDTAVTARGPAPGQTIYAGTKGMVDNFTKCWAKELPPVYHCTVNAVSPGPTRTEVFMDAGPEAMEILQPTINSTPVAKRMAEGEEIAYLAGCLYEERARWINGTHVIAAGGLFVD